MFNLFKKKSPIERLEAQHKKLLQESFELSKVNRTKSDEKVAEAEAVMKQIQDLTDNHS